MDSSKQVKICNEDVILEDSQEIIKEKFNSKELKISDLNQENYNTLKILTKEINKVKTDLNMCKKDVEVLTNSTYFLKESYKKVFSENYSIFNSNFNKFKSNLNL